MQYMKIFKILFPIQDLFHRYNKAGQADLQSVARTSQEIFDKLQKHNPEYLQRFIGNVSNAANLPGESEESWNSANVVR